METTTVNKMNYLALKDDERMGVRLPSVMKKEVIETSESQGMGYSAYTKLALLEKMERDQAVPD